MKRGGEEGEGGLCGGFSMRILAPWRLPRCSWNTPGKVSHAAWKPGDPIPRMHSCPRGNTVKTGGEGEKWRIPTCRNVRGWRGWRCCRILWFRKVASLSLTFGKIYLSFYLYFFFIFLFLFLYIYFLNEKRERNSFWGCRLFLFSKSQLVFRPGKELFRLPIDIFSFFFLLFIFSLFFFFFFFFFSFSSLDHQISCISISLRACACVCVSARVCLCVRNTRHWSNYIHYLFISTRLFWRK